MPKKPIHHDEDDQWSDGQIRAFSKNAKMTQADLANGIGGRRYQKYISGYEDGQDHMPVSVYFAIIEALKAAPGEMLPPRLFDKKVKIFHFWPRFSMYMISVICYTVDRSDMETGKQT